MNRLFLATLLLTTSCSSFQGPAFAARPMSSSTDLFAKKNKGQSAAGQGFGKAAPELKQPATTTSDDAPTSVKSISRAPAGGLQSVEMGGSDAIPTFKADPNMPVGERTKQILQQQYGLRTLEEQRREEKLIEQRNKIQRLKEEAEKDENFDVFALLPPALLIGIDRFLKIGLSICTITFVAAGLGITAEAWSAASGNVLPEEIDSFIVNIVEPNFTPGLLVLLAFSVSLGIFATAQMGSAGSSYSEDP